MAKKVKINFLDMLSPAYNPPGCEHPYIVLGNGDCPALGNYRVSHAERRREPRLSPRLRATLSVACRRHASPSRVNVPACQARPP